MQSITLTEKDLAEINTLFFQKIKTYNKLKDRSSKVVLCFDNKIAMLISFESTKGWSKRLFIVDDKL